MQSRLPRNPSEKTIPTFQSSGPKGPRDEAGSIVLPLPLPRAAVSIEGTVRFHLVDARLAQKAPRLAGFVLDAIHHGILAIAMRTGLRSAHGHPVSRAEQHIEILCSMTLRDKPAQR